MAYVNKPTSISSPQLDSISLIKNRGTSGNIGEFYEIEPGVVLDIILDKNHPYFKKKPFKVNPNKWPADVSGITPQPTDPDYTWMGRILVRMLYTQRNVEKEDLVWATPLESNISEYPLVNEIVGVVEYLGQYYYTRKINSVNTPNSNADFKLELNNGGFKETPESTIKGNRELLLNSNDPIKEFQGPTSKLKIGGGYGYEGALGRYFVFNPRIRSLKRREGDMVFESRFGQSIRFAAYDDTRENDKGYNSLFSGYKDYRGDGTKYTSIDGNTYEQGGGNPMILIRNRQRPITKENTTQKIYENLPPVIGSAEEKNLGGYIVEDINNDGTSIHITSGTTVSNFKTNCSKIMWGNGNEEQPGFSGITNFTFPILMGDQITINSDRVILSARNAEFFNYSKKRYSIVTDDEFTLDSHNQIVLTTNNKTVLNSPAIYLGEYNQTNEPVLLGQTSVNWMYDLCQWLAVHTHWYKHSHPDAGQANPDKTQTTVQAASLMVLRDKLNTLLSRRVFVTGGGFAPGKNGGNIKNNIPPVSVTLPSGEGLPGGFSGVNKKTSASEKIAEQNNKEAAIKAAQEAEKSSIQAKEDYNTIVNLINQTNIINNGLGFRNAVNTKISLNKLNTHVKLANTYAKQSSDASNVVLTTDNNILAIEYKAIAVDSSNKTKQESLILSQEKQSAQNALITAQTLQKNKFGL